MPPNCSAAAAAIACTSSRFVTSAVHATEPLPISPAALAAASASRSTTSTRAPSRA